MKIVTKTTRARRIVRGGMFQVLREHLGRTQEQVAFEIGMTQMMVSRIENGKPVDERHARRLVAYYFDSI